MAISTQYVSLAGKVLVESSFGCGAYGGRLRSAHVGFKADGLDGDTDECCVGGSWTGGGGGYSRSTGTVGTVMIIYGVPSEREPEQFGG